MGAFFVLRQMVRATERTTTNVTFVRAFTGVCAKMSCELVTTSEPPFTVLERALVRLLALDTHKADASRHTVPY